MTDLEYIGSAGRLRLTIESAVKGFFRNTEDTADVIQDVMMWLWIRRTDIDFQKVEALAFTMARNHAVSILRKQALSATEALGNNDSSSQRNALWAMEESENAQLLSAALETLTKTELHIFRMRHEGDMSTEQVAAVLDISERTVSATLSKARRKILDQIKKNM